MSSPPPRRVAPGTAKDGALRVGTSGWTYDWPRFYGDAPKTRRLERYAERFDAVEVNASFYRLMTQETYARWRDVTPPGFRFAIKANRYLTHLKRLIDPASSIALERERAEALGDKLAVVLWQIPARQRRDDERLAGWLRALDRGWPDVRHAFEPRHRSWFTDEVARRLEDHGVAVCMSDSPRWPLWDRVTTDLVYVRLHGHTRLYRSGYASATLRRWAERVRRWRARGLGVHVYFDNTDEQRAPWDALRLRAMLEPDAAARAA